MSPTKVAVAHMQSLSEADWVGSGPGGSHEVGYGTWADCALLDLDP